MYTRGKESGSARAASLEKMVKPAVDFPRKARTFSGTLTADFIK